MLKKIIFPAFLIALTALSSCKKDDTPAVKSDQTVVFDVSSTGDLNVSLKVSNNSGFVFIESQNPVKTYKGQYTKLKVGEKVEAVVEGKTGIAINSTLKIDGVSINPTTDVKNVGGNDVKTWVIDIK